MKTIEQIELSEKSFKEDFEHENGKYINSCGLCKDEFMGHKRRNCCKKCKEIKLEDNEND